MSTVRQFRVETSKLQSELRKLTETKGAAASEAVPTEEEIHSRQLRETDSILSRTTQSIER